MKNIIIRKMLYGGYNSETLEDASNCKLEIIADWLIDDVGNWHSWCEWLDNSDYDYTDSNATWLRKTWENDKCMVTMGSLMHMMLNTKKGVYAPKETEVARLTKANVIELLNTWEQLLKTRPEKIMITEENGVYKMFAVQ